MLDYPEPDTIQPGPPLAANGQGSHPGLFMTRCQKHRQRVYKRTRRMVGSPGHAHPDVENAQAEAALGRAQACISRARGGQLG